MRLLKELLTGYLIGVALVTVLFILASAAHCAVGKKHDNSIGSVMYTSNPLMYQAGYIAQSQDAITSVDGNLNLRIAPIGTYMLYDESVLFCGMPTDKFKGRTEPFVLTYERAAHHQVRGVGCHELIRVDSMQITKELQ